MSGNRDESAVVETPSQPQLRVWGADVRASAILDDDDLDEMVRWMGVMQQAADTDDAKNDTRSAAVVGQKRSRRSQQEEDEQAGDATATKRRLLGLLESLGSSAVRARELQRVHSSLLNTETGPSGAVWTPLDRQHLHLLLMVFRRLVRGIPVGQNLSAWMNMFDLAVKKHKKDQNNGTALGGLESALQIDSPAAHLVETLRKDQHYVLDSQAQSSQAVLGVVPLNRRMLRTARDCWVDLQVAGRRRYLEQVVRAHPWFEADQSHSNRRVHEALPVSVRKEAMGLHLIRMQMELRKSVVACGTANPNELITSRSLKTLQAAYRARSRRLRRRPNRVIRQMRKERRDFLQAVSTHTKEFFMVARRNQRQTTRIAKDVKRWAEEAQARHLSIEKQQERERVAALRENDKEKYLQLLKKTKNERIRTLLRQTDAYMDKLTSQIESHRNEPEGGAPGRKGKTAKSSGKGNDDVDLSKFSGSRYHQVAHAIKEPITEQPTALVAGQLRAYQLQGLEWLVSLYNNNLNGILADEMGLGKTVQSVSLLAYLMEKKNNFGPFLVIAPMSTLHNNWEFEFTRWLPSAQVVVYDGDKTRRKALRETVLLRKKFNIVLTTYEFSMRDKAFLRRIPWEYIIVDEAHRLKNPSCKLSRDIQEYNPHARRVALTGTPLQNNLPELWALLNFLHPTIFESCDTFEKWFSSPFTDIKSTNEDSMEMNEEEKMLIIDRLHSVLRPFVLRREKSQVERDLADKIEKVIRCPLSPVQWVMYRTIAECRVSMHNRMMQLRKVCNHPYLFHPAFRQIMGSEFYRYDDDILHMSGKYQVLDQILQRMKASNHRVLIFNQMTKNMDLMEEYMAYRGYPCLRLDGSTSAEDRASYLKKFNDPNSPYFVFMLSTRAGGLGLNLQTADTVILFDSDWNPQNDLQAQARAHRIGQKQQVLVIRLITAGTIEEKVLTTAYQKLDAEAMVIKAGQFHRKFSVESQVERMKSLLKKREGGGGDQDEDSFEDVSVTIARSQEEVEQFREMDKADRNRLAVFLRADEQRRARILSAARKRGGGLVTSDSCFRGRVIPGLAAVRGVVGFEAALSRFRVDKSGFPSFVPAWVVHWCLHGSHSKYVGQDMRPFIAQVIFSAENPRAASSNANEAKEDKKRQISTTSAPGPSTKAAGMLEGPGSPRPAYESVSEMTLSQLGLASPTSGARVAPALDSAAFVLDPLMQSAKSAGLAKAVLPWIMRLVGDAVLRDLYLCNGKGIVPEVILAAAGKIDQVGFGVSATGRKRRAPRVEYIDDIMIDPPSSSSSSSSEESSSEDDGKEAPMVDVAEKKGRKPITVNIGPKKNGKASRSHIRIRIGK